MMNRSPFILGFTLLVIAATWVVSITLSRLEADLIDSTGGDTPTIAASPTEIPTETTTTPATIMPATEERVAPAARENGNLFDLLDP
jgi:hypothetical protein